MAAIGRPREFDRDVALEAAMRTFWKKGFVATSMNDLCTAMGIRSPSLYAAFKSKEALYLEAMTHYANSRGKVLWGVLSDDGTAREAVERLLSSTVDAMLASDERPAGCMITLGGVGDAWPDAVAEIAPRLRGECLDALRSRIAAGVAAGELSASTDVDRYARFYVGIMQAMAIQAKDGAKRTELSALVETAMENWPSR